MGVDLVGTKDQIFRQIQFEGSPKVLKRPNMCPTISRPLVNQHHLLIFASTSIRKFRFRYLHDKFIHALIGDRGHFGKMGSDVAPHLSLSAWNYKITLKAIHILVCVVELVITIFVCMSCSQLLQAVLK